MKNPVGHTCPKQILIHGRKTLPITLFTAKPHSHTYAIQSTKLIDPLITHTHKETLK